VRGDRRRDDVLVGEAACRAGNGACAAQGCTVETDHREPAAHDTPDRPELPKFGIARPRIGIAGLNPHAGEHGLLGLEEEFVFTPAIARAAADGIDVAGPFAADTIFVRALGGEFDVVVAAYHDQGLVAVKLVAFGHAVNVTLGLPIIRTSVDHGTAFDIARQNVADAGSLVEAILLAARLARGY
jgi:4-hydroxy-L-threonine phosphate dehydrogenase PdxA